MNAMRRIDPKKAGAITKAPTPGSQSVAPPPRRVIDSTALFADGSEILIAHAGSHYRLTITRQGKLILTK